MAGLIDRALQRFARAIIRAAGIRVPGAPEWQWGLPIPGDALELDFPNAYRLVPDIYACISLIQNTIAELPLKFYRGQGDDKVEIERGRDGGGARNVADLWALANSQDTGYELIEQLVGSLEINGNAYLFLETLGSTSVDELWMIPGHFCKPVPGPNRSVRGYLYDNGGGTRQMLDPAQIVHFKNYDPDATGLGLSPLRVAQLEYETQHDAHKWNREFYRRGGAVSNFFLLENALDPAERTRVQVDLEKRFQGVKNAWNVIVLPKGVKPQPGGLSQKDMQFIESANLTTADILRIFKIPPVIMGIKDGGGLSDAGATTDQELFWQNCIKPRCRRIETTINERFLTPDRFGRGISCEFDYAQVIPYQEIFLNQAKAYVEATGGPIMLRSEARERLGLIELDEETLEEMLVPSTMRPAGEEPQPLTGAGALSPPAQLPQAASRSRTKMRELASAQLDAHERAFRSSMRRLFSRQERRVVSKMQAKLSTRARITDLEDLLHDDNADRVLVRGLMRSIVKRRGVAALSELALRLAFDMSERKIGEWVGHKAARLVTQINETTRKMLRESLAEGVTADETIGELTARVREIFNDRRANASTIARTETAGAYNFASEMAWEQSGIVQGKEWLTSHDEHVRDSHNRAEALGVVPLSEPFRFTGERGGVVTMQFPGDPIGPPEEVINCRCTALPALISLGDQLSAAPSKNGHKATLTFEELKR